MMPGCSKIETENVQANNHSAKVRSCTISCTNVNSGHLNVKMKFYT
jgi:hypothetical protein